MFLYLPISVAILNYWLVIEPLAIHGLPVFIGYNKSSFFMLICKKVCHKTSSTMLHRYTSMA